MTLKVLPRQKIGSHPTSKYLSPELDECDTLDELGMDARK
jgi:hypothetical protein